MKTRHTVLLIALCCPGLVAGVALAEFPESTPDRIQVDIGGTFASLDTNAGVTVEGSGIGTIVNLEEVMNLDTSATSWRIDGNWRFTRAQHLDFGYFGYDRSGSRVNTETIQWGEYTFNKGNRLDGTFDTSFIYAAYRYDFLQDPHVRISGSAGISYIDIAGSLSGTGSIGTPDGTEEGSFSREVSVKAPVPLLGLQLNWAMSKNWELMWFGRFLFINQPDLSGSINQSSIRVKWWFLEHVGAGLGYDRQEIVLRRYRDGDTTVKGGLNIAGWSAYLTLAF